MSEEDFPEIGSMGDIPYEIGKLSLILKPENHCRFDVFTFPNASLGYVLCVDLEPIGHAADVTQLVKLFASTILELAKETSPVRTMAEEVTEANAEVVAGAKIDSGKEVIGKTKMNRPATPIPRQQQLANELRAFLDGKAQSFESDPLADQMK